jgi:fructokinase
MPEKRYLVAGLGEVLWDLFPEGKQLGGAPANFAYVSTVLGNHGVVASRVGGDELGAEAIRHLGIRSLDCNYLQLDPQLPTGTVKVQVDSQGQPNFEISEPSAWDALAWTTEWRELAEKVDAVCFGSLAQRSAKSRVTIQAFLRGTRPEALRVFDVNLRQQYYSAEILTSSFELANVVKMNEDEFFKISQMLGWSFSNMESAARQLCETYDLKLVCVTRGPAGSLLVTRSSSHPHPGIAVTVVDTVGAGDAFTAGLVYEYLKGKSLEQSTLAAMNETANRMGARVAQQAGGMPEIKNIDTSSPRAKFFM